MDKSSWVFPDDGIAGADVTHLEQWGSRPTVNYIGKVVKVTATQIIAQGLFGLESRWRRSDGKPFGHSGSHFLIRPTTDEHRQELERKRQEEAAATERQAQRQALADQNRVGNLQRWAAAIQTAATLGEAIELLEAFHSRSIFGDLGQEWPLPEAKGEANG